MKMPEIMQEIERLAHSQGFYSRLYLELLELKETDIEEYERLSIELEKEGFESLLDIVLYFEEGKHCKRKFWKIPVTWQLCGTVEVEANTIEEAIEEFYRIENSGEEFSLPADNEYVDGSFQLSTDDIDELKELIQTLSQ